MWYSWLTRTYPPPSASKPFVKKKAALTLLRLYRKHPPVVQAEWTERIISIMDDPDVGVCLSVTSLVMALIQDYPEQYRGSYVKAAQRLAKLVHGTDVPPDYIYHRVPCPWLQVKLLRLLQYYPPSEDSHVQVLIKQSLEKIIATTTDVPRNVQQNNAQNAIHFEAINLLIFLGTEPELLVRVSARLGKFIQSRETNVRYLGLDAMTHLASRADIVDTIKKHQDIILNSLRDRDISVRRKGLDLIYSMCDTSNARPIVNELMHYLSHSDFSMREELVLKIAILTEKYATDARWYIDVSLNLLQLAGDHVNDEVWQRVIQIVANNEEIQPYAVEHILRYVRIQCHDSVVKIGAYVLGEFGHLVADIPGCSPIEQFMALQTRMTYCADTTRAMILSCFIKFVNLFPEIKPQLLHVFTIYSRSPDSELQQRACEYLKLAVSPNEELLRTVCDEMPPFAERTSVLLARLHQKTAGVTDKRTWIVGGKDANADQKEFEITHQQQQLTGLGVTKSFSFPANTTENAVTGAPTPTQTSASADLLGLEVTSPASAIAKRPTGADALNLATAEHLSPGWEAGYERLYFANHGVLFEDTQFKIGYRSEFRAHLGVCKITFHNRLDVPIGAFTTTIDNPSRDALKIDTKALPDPDVKPSDQTQTTITFEARQPFTKPPTIRISYIAGSLQAYTLQLPILMHKYMQPSALAPSDFFAHWQQIGAGAPLEAQSTFAVTPRKAHNMTEPNTRRIVEGFGWKIVADVDPNASNVVGCSVFQTSQLGKVGCLLRLEPHYEEKVCLSPCPYLLWNGRQCQLLTVCLFVIEISHNDPGDAARYLRFNDGNHAGKIGEW